MMMAAGALALAGCPTYSEESRRGAAGDEEVARAVDRGATEGAEDVLPIDDEPEEAAPEEAEPAPEPASEPGEPTMHRQGAGEPDDTGWYAAASTNGGFEVELPGAFDDYEVAPDAEQVMHVVQAEHEGSRYLVQCSMGGETPQEKLAAIEEQIGMIDEVEQRRRVEHAGGEGVEFRLSGQGATVTIRSLALEGALCQMIVEGPSATYPAREAARFMDSFALADG